MTQSDDEFLRAIKIAPWPDADSYKLKKEIKEMSQNEINELFARATDDQNNDDFAYYDEYSEEDPFVEVNPEEDMLDESIDDSYIAASTDVEEPVEDTYEEEDQYKVEIRSRLRFYIEEFLVFSTRDELYDLIDEV